MSHTPGPWTIGKKRGSECTVYDTEGCIVASAQYNPMARPNSTEQMLPNARLIAAAPDMYEELKQIHFACLHTYISEDFLKRFAAHVGALLDRVEGQ